MNKPNTKATQYEIGKIVWDFGSNTIQSWNGVAWTPVNPSGSVPTIDEVLLPSNINLVTNKLLTFGSDPLTTRTQLNSSGVFVTSGASALSFIRDGSLQVGAFSGVSVTPNFRFSVTTTTSNATSTLLNTTFNNRIVQSLNLADEGLSNTLGIFMSKFSERTALFSSNGITVRGVTAGQATNMLLSAFTQEGNAGNYVLSTETLSLFNTTESVPVSYSTNLTSSYGNVIKLANSSAATSADALIPVYSKATLKGLMYMTTVTLDTASLAPTDVMQAVVTDALITTSSKIMAVITDDETNAYLTVPTLYVELFTGSASIRCLKGSLPNNRILTVTVLIQY